MRRNVKFIRSQSSVSTNLVYLKDTPEMCRAIKLPPPNRETLSRHSFLGPNGFRSQWRGPSAEIKVSFHSGIYLFILLLHFCDLTNEGITFATQVQYPSSSDLATIEIPIDSG